MRERKNHILLYPGTGDPFTIITGKVTKSDKNVTNVN